MLFEQRKFLHDFALHSEILLTKHYSVLTLMKHKRILFVININSIPFLSHKNLAYKS